MKLSPFVFVFVFAGLVASCVASNGDTYTLSCKQCIQTCLTNPAHSLNMTNSVTTCVEGCIKYIENCSVDAINASTRLHVDKFPCLFFVIAVNYLV